MNKPLSDIDLNEWWDDLTIEQKNAAFELWTQSDIKTVYSSDYTELEPNGDLFDQIRKKIVWDQDRFPRPLAWDEDRFKDKPVSEQELQEWLRKQHLRGPSKRYG
jgi:hypothetical protein